MNKTTPIAALCLVLLTPLGTLAEDAHHKLVTAAGNDDMTDGEVRKIDKQAAKVTIKHGEIKNLEMPAMTMVFRVQDPTLLDRLKAGDKVRFRAEKSGSALVVTAIEQPR